MRIAVIGHGYVGSSLCSAASAAGHEIIAIDKDPDELSKVVKGYRLSHDYSLCLDRDVIIIALPTPVDSSLKPDLSQIEEVCLKIEPFTNSNALLISESTSYPGTLRNVIAPRLPLVRFLATAPERIDPASNSWNIKNTPRIVGALSQPALMKATNFYRTICDVVIPVASSEIAESAKLLENTFRQVNIALANEFAKILHSSGISPLDVIAAAKTKPFGFMEFWPGVGVGGHCIPVDPMYLQYFAKQFNNTFNLVGLAHEINNEMPVFIADELFKKHSLHGKRVQVSGIAYKSNVADIRESPALEMIKRLRIRGAKVIWHDNLVGSTHSEKSDPLQNVDLGIIAVNHLGVDYSPWKDVNVVDLTPTADLGFPKFFGSKT